MTSLIISALYRLLGRLSLGSAQRLGAIVGRLVYRFSPTYRRLLLDNLALAYPAGVPEGLAEAVAEGTGRMMLEIPCLWQRPLDQVLEAVREVRGWELLDDAWARGEGILAITPHLGCFEMIPLYFGTRAPMTFMFRPPKQKWLREIVAKGRVRPNLSPVPADNSGLRLLMRALKRGETVGILPDQVPGKGQGVWARYFGKYAYTMTLAARLSEMNRVSVFVIFAERLPKGEGFILHFLRPAVPLEGDLQQRVEAINRSVESLVLQYPEQYLWGYNRYKKSSRIEGPPGQESP